VHWKHTAEVTSGDAPGVRVADGEMDLPLEQVLEAQVYYQTHRQLVESEMEEKKLHLLSQGVEP